jgi:hypothetical protein
MFLILWTLDYHAFLNDKAKLRMNVLHPWKHNLIVDILGNINNGDGWMVNNVFNTKHIFPSAIFLSLNVTLTMNWLWTVEWCLHKWQAFLVDGCETSMKAQCDSS